MYSMINRAFNGGPEKKKTFQTLSHIIFDMVSCDMCRRRQIIYSETVIEA